MPRYQEDRNFNDSGLYCLSYGLTKAQFEKKYGIRPLASLLLTARLRSSRLVTNSRPPALNTDIIPERLGHGRYSMIQEA